MTLDFLTLLRRCRCFGKLCLSLLLLLLCVCFGFGNKVSRSRRLSSTRARARLLNRRGSLLFCVLRLLSASFLRRKRTPQPGGTLSFQCPGCGSSSGCDSPWLLGERGTPLAPGSLGRPRRQTPKDDEAPPRLTEKSGRARARSRRAPGAQPARSSARERRVFAACNPARLRGVQPGTSSRRATGTSSRRATGTSPRRAFCAVRRTQTRARARDLERVITTLRLSVRLRARFAASRIISFLDRSISDSGC